MKTIIRLIVLAILAFYTVTVSSQTVGIGTKDPKSTLDIVASNPSAPSNQDGLLIPRISSFPSTNPGVAQDGMLVFLTTTSGSYSKGFHYWDNTRTEWIAYNDEWKDGFVSQPRGDFSDNLIYAKQASDNSVDVVILDSGHMGLGTNKLEESLEVKLEGDNDIQISSASPPDAPQLVFYTTDGTFASPDYLDDGDKIGYMTGKVWAGSSKSGDVSNVQMSADGNHSSGNLPTKIQFTVTEPNSTSVGEHDPELVIRATGNVGIGVNNPSAVLNIKAGTASSNSAPLKLTSGTNLSTPETGAVEYDGNELYFTPGTVRKTLLTGLARTQALDFPNIATSATSELTVTVTGAVVGSSCSCAPRTSIENGLQWNCYVSASNTVRVRVSNFSNIAVNPANKDWNITVFQ